MIDNTMFDSCQKVLRGRKKKNHNHHLKSNTFNTQFVFACVNYMKKDIDFLNE